MENEFEELQIALINLKNAGDNIEDSHIRFRIDDFVEYIENKLQEITNTKHS